MLKDQMISGDVISIDIVRGDRADAGDGSSQDHHRIFGKVLFYIDQNLAERITLLDMEQVSGMSRFQLIRLFRGRVGVTPYMFLINRRVSRAAERLRHGEAIAHVAADLGFCDQSHLTRHFKRAYGLTPAQYAGASGRA